MYNKESPVLKVTDVYWEETLVSLLGHFMDTQPTNQQLVAFMLFSSRYPIKLKFITHFLVPF